MQRDEKMRDNRLLIPTLLMSFLLILLGCSSFFSFSWKTKKEVKNKQEPRAQTARKGFQNQSPPALNQEENPESGRVGHCSEVQITRLRQESPAALEQFMERLGAHGVRTIYFRVFQNPGDSFFKVLPLKAKDGVYFKTSRAPLVSDLLPMVCRFAHENGIKVYAWMNTLRAGFLRCEGARKIYRFDPDKGSLVPTRRWSPFDPGIQACLVDLFRDLARNPVDGILVQDDLVLHYNEDLSVFARRRFMEDSGTPSFSPDDLYQMGRSEDGKRKVRAYTPLFWTWCRWKSRILSEFIGKLKASAKSVRPSITFAVDINYEALSAPENGLAWYSRSIRTLEEVAHPDRYVVMSYQEQMREELEKSEPVILGTIRGMITTALRLVPDPNRWTFKVQTLDWRTREPVASNQISKTMETIISVAPVHVCLMPYTKYLFEDGLLARFNPTGSVKMREGKKE